MSTVTKKITAEEFAGMPNPGFPCELVGGEIVEMNPPRPRHGQICGNIVYIGRRFNEDHDCMHVLANDTGVITERDPDTVRGPDVWFISYEKVPKGPLANDTYLEIVPDIVFEVISPSDRWDDISSKVNEYLALGVSAVCVLEPQLATVQVFAPDKSSRTFASDEELTFAEILPEFSVAVQRFFE